MGSERQKTLVGPVIVLRTVRTNDGKLDLDKQRRHLRWLIDSGITQGNGVIMGGGGASEGAFMPEEGWKAIVRLTGEECRGRTQAWQAYSTSTPQKPHARPVSAKTQGIQFIQLSPPHYMAPTEGEVFGHYKRVSDAADVMYRNWQRFFERIMPVAKN